MEEVHSEDDEMMEVEKSPSESSEINADHDEEVNVDEEEEVLPANSDDEADVDM